MRTAVFLLALLLVPAVAAGPTSKASFEVVAGQSRTFQLTLDKAGDVTLAIHFNAGYVRGLRLDGPGTCDRTIDSSGGLGDSTMGGVHCRLPAGPSTFTLRLDAGYVKGYLAANKGRWTAPA